MLESKVTLGNILWAEFCCLKIHMVESFPLEPQSMAVFGVMVFKEMFMLK